MQPGPIAAIIFEAVPGGEDPLDENDLSPGTYTAGQAWSSLWGRVNRRARTPSSLIYSSEIHDAS